MALEFLSASSQYCQTSDHASINPTGAITVCGWVELVNNPPTNIIIFQKPYTAYSEPYYQYYLGVTSGIITWQLSIGGARYEASKSLSWNLNQWYFLCGTYDGANLKVYRDLSEEDDTAQAGVIDTYATDLFISKYGQTTIYGNQTCYDLRIYNRLLSTTEQAIIRANRGNDNIVNGLVARYLMDEKPDTSTASGAGSVIDVSPYGNHSTATNTPTYEPSIITLI